MNNLGALLNFVEFNDIERDSFGRCYFDADVTIYASGNGGAESTEVRISFANGDPEQLTITEGGNFIAGQVPLGYKVSHGVWVHTNGILVVTGNYNRRFDYNTEVRLAR